MIPDFPHIIKIRLAPLKKKLLRPDFAKSLPCWLGQFCWDSQQGRDFAKSGHNKKLFWWGQSYFYIMRKVWYHQIWIQSYFGFIVLILMYIQGGSVMLQHRSQFSDRYQSGSWNKLNLRGYFSIWSLHSSKNKWV